MKPIDNVMGSHNMPVAGDNKEKSGSQPTLELSLVQSYLAVRVYGIMQWLYGSHAMLVVHSVIQIGKTDCMTT